MFDDFYGFTARPFQLTPDPAFWFESATHHKALSYLGYGLGQGEGFIVITGEVGAGKSTLVAHLMATIDRQRLTAAQIVTSNLSGTDLVHIVAQAFAVVHEGEAALGRETGQGKAHALGAIEAFLHAEARAGRRCLLVVDESQNLSDEALEELRMLTNFQLGAHPLLQILLLGQPEFRDRLAGHPGLEQLRQRVIAAHHLEPMAPEEIDPYLTHRLKLVGWNGHPTFAPALLADIHQVTGGLPRRINQIVNRLLMLGAAQQHGHIDSPLLVQVLTEMNVEGALPLAVPTAAVAPQPGDAHHDLSDQLSEQAAQIAELQQAVIELANSHDQPGVQDHVAGIAAELAASHTAEMAADRAAHRAAIAALQERVDALETRQCEQDRTLRHTLTMLIEWIERDGNARHAA